MKGPAATDRRAERREIGVETAHAVSAHGFELMSGGYEQAPHRHERAQLLLGITGLITCTVADGLWMVPPGCAVWVPGGTEHSVRASGKLELYILKVDTRIAPDLPRETCTMAVSPLLRELVIEAARITPGGNEDGPGGRLVRTMLDQLAIAPVERLHLPMPADPRLRQIAAAITADPSDRATVGEWARRVGMSERTLFRLVPRETGMSFGRWRQQFHIMVALERLTGGEAVQTIALDLGYESASAFITMFRRVLGQPPARYLAARRDRSDLTRAAA